MSPNPNRSPISRSVYPLHPSSLYFTRWYFYLWRSSLIFPARTSVYICLMRTKSQNVHYKKTDVFCSQIRNMLFVSFFLHQLICSYVKHVVSGVEKAAHITLLSFLCLHIAVFFSFARPPQHQQRQPLSISLCTVCPCLSLLEQIRWRLAVSQTVT